MVEKLEAISPIFNGWEFLADSDDDHDATVGLDRIRANMAAWVKDNVTMYEGDPDPASGYTMYGRSHFQTDAPDPSRGISMSLVAGSKHSNNISLGVGSVMYAADPSVIDVSQFERALQAVVSVWNCPWASAGAYPLADFKSGRSLYFAGSQWRPIYGMAWMAYLSADRANGLVVPHEIATKRLPGGGMLLIAEETRLDPDNPDHVRRSAMLGDILAEHGGNPAR